jgi:PKHD-type hydroxylase
MRMFKVFSDDEVKSTLETLEKLTWQDGKETALGGAKDIKNNQQITPKDSEFRPIAELVKKKILDKTSVISNYAFPRAIVGVRANRYGVGQTYGWHVDFSHMEGLRTDMSFTLFLKDPKSYEGGGLEIYHGQYKTSIKGKPGEMVIYPTGLLHRVVPVTSGERTCIVGWINSFIAIEECRHALFTIAVNNAKLRKELGPDREEIKQINYSYFQLQRFLSD